MERIQTMNPFAKRESHNKRSLLIHRVLSLFTWLLVLVLAIIYSTVAPTDGRSIWDQNKAHPTPFSLNPQIASTYWAILLFFQFGYIYFLYSFNTEIVNIAANVGSHFIVHNLLTSAFILLWVHSSFWIGELMLILDAFNLTSLYFRHPRTLYFIHIPIVTGPLAWNFVAVLWNGAAMVGAQGLAARIIANIAIWSILLYGTFFMAAFKDHSMGFELTILTASLAVHQFRVAAVGPQWVLAMVIAVLLLMAALAITVPRIWGKELVWKRSDDDDEDSEREPLLEEDLA